MGAHYKNTPAGLGSMSENLHRVMRPVALEDIAAVGNRAQRRWAEKKLKETERKTARREKAPGGGNV